MRGATVRDTQRRVSLPGRRDQQRTRRVAVPQSERVRVAYEMLPGLKIQFMSVWNDADAGQS